jgi:hypothetical protein
MRYRLLMQLERLDDDPCWPILGELCMGEVVVETDVQHEERVVALFHDLQERVAAQLARIPRALPPSRVFSMPPASYPASPL